SDCSLDCIRKLLQRGSLLVVRLDRQLDPVRIALLRVAEHVQHRVLELDLVDDFDRHPLAHRVGEADRLNDLAVEAHRPRVGGIRVGEDHPDAAHQSFSRFGDAARTASISFATSGPAASSSVKVAIPSRFMWRALKLTNGPEKRPPGMLTWISFSIWTWNRSGCSVWPNPNTSTTLPSKVTTPCSQINSMNSLMNPPDWGPPRAPRRSAWRAPGSRPPPS